MISNEFNEMQRVTADVEAASQHLANPLLDKLTKTNVYGYYFAYTLLIACFTYDGLSHLRWSVFASTLLIGVIIWSFTEYLIHRFLFHWKSSSAFLKIITFMFHGVHHAYPRDVQRSITPLIFTLPTAAIFYVIFKFIFNEYVDGVFTGFILGYVMYSIIHDSTHHFAMNYPILKQLKKNHMRHHYFDIHQNFGVSSPLWDIIFRTYVKNKIPQQTS